MEHPRRGSTFGSRISSARRERFLAPSEILEYHPALGALINVRELNELEQDRRDPRKHPRADDLFRCLADALALDETELRDLAKGYERAAAIQREFQQHIEVEAVAFRARLQRG